MSNHDSPSLPVTETINGVTRHRLKNGMVLLLKEQHTAPVISWWVLYRVGSRNEPTGLTGVSHWVEHMLFKGTEEFPAGYLDKAIDRAGGAWNAQTSYDYTAYHETMPADRIDLALRAEADRMINAKFDPEEVESERTVIISERQGSENDPSYWLDEEVSAAAFRVHGYHHSIIGDKIDLQTMTRDDLYGHYQAHYSPNNAIGAIVGDFDTTEMIARLESLYGDLPPRPRPRTFVRPEPPQQGERRVTVERPGGAPFLSIAHKVPECTHPDWVKLYILDAVLGGASGFGGSVGNRTTRFYQTLVKGEIAAGFSSGLMQSIDPGLYGIDLTLREARTHAEAEAAVYGVLQQAIDGQITQQELDRVKKQLRALIAFGTETVTSQAFRLAYFEHIAGDFNWFLTYADRINAVTLSDLQEVAIRYLTPKTRVVGHFIPTNDPTADPTAESEAETEDTEAYEEPELEVDN